MMSYTWKLRENRFHAVGRIACRDCGKDYYRKFKPLYRTFSSQLPLNSVPRKLQPLTLIDDSRNGGGCSSGIPTAYTILMPSNKGSSGKEGLPALRVFAQSGDLFRANDIPLEALIIFSIQFISFCRFRTIYFFLS